MMRFISLCKENNTHIDISFVSTAEGRRVVRVGAGSVESKDFSSWHPICPFTFYYLLLVDLTVTKSSQFSFLHSRSFLVCIH